MKYYYNNAEEGIVEVNVEDWIWGVIYKDGKEFKQYEIDSEDTTRGVFHRVGEIKQEDVKLWVLRNPKTDRRIDIILPEGARIIHKYRRYRLNIGTDQECKKTVYIFGYRTGKKNSYRYYYNFVMPNGNIIQGDQENPKLTELGL